MNKYVYGVKIKNGTVIVAVTEKERWVKGKQYSNVITEDLKNLFKSLGYYFVKRNFQFESENNGKSIKEIIDDLNENSILEYNEEFNNFSSTYVYSFFKSKEAGNMFILCVTPKAYWLNNKCLDDNQPDTHIYNFVESIGLLEHSESTFSLPKKKSKEKDIISDKLNDFKYLEANEDFVDYMKNIY